GQGDGRPHPEPSTETLPFDSAELRCFPFGRNEPAGPAMIAAVDQLSRTLAQSSPQPDLTAVLGPAPDAVPSARLTLRADRLQRLVIPSERDLDIPVFLIQPAGSVQGVVIALDDRGKEAVASDAILSSCLAQSWAVCGVDPRGIGESATDKMGWVFAVSLLL